MLSSQVTFLLAISCIVPAFLGLFIYSGIEKKFRPFIYIMWLVAITELIARLGNILRQKIITATAYNTSFLITIILFVLFFFNVQVIKNKRLAYLLIALSFLAWVAAWVYYKSWLITFVFYYMFIGIVVVALSVELLNRQVFKLKMSPYRNFLFLIPATLILHFGVYIFVTTSMMLGTIDPELRGRLFSIFMIVNACSYLLYAYAMLCLPKLSVANSEPY